MPVPRLDMHSEGQRYPPRCRSYCTPVNNPPSASQSALIPFPLGLVDKAWLVLHGDVKACRLLEKKGPRSLMPEFSHSNHAGLGHSRSRNTPPVPGPKDIECLFITMHSQIAFGNASYESHTQA